MVAGREQGREPGRGGAGDGGGGLRTDFSRCLRHLETSAMLFFFSCAFSLSRVACICFWKRFPSRCFRLQTGQVGGGG